MTASRWFSRSIPAALIATGMLAACSDTQPTQMVHNPASFGAPPPGGGGVGGTVTGEAVVGKIKVCNETSAVITFDVAGSSVDGGTFSAVGAVSLDPAACMLVATDFDNDSTLGANISLNQTSTGAHDITAERIDDGNPITTPMSFTDGGSLLLNGLVGYTLTFRTPSQALTELGSARIWLGVTTSSGNGTKVDLQVNVYKNGVLVGTGSELKSPVTGADAVDGKNAKAFDVALNLVGTNVTFAAGDQLVTTVSVRRVGGSSDVGVRFWHNNSVGNGSHRGWSNFMATIGGAPRSYYFLDGGSLATDAGSTAVASVVMATTAYQVFGTWSVTLQ